MRRVVFLFFMVASLLHCKEFYSEEVLSIYLGKDDTKAAGRLLPTNPFEILQTEGNRSKIRIRGYVNPQSPSVIYFNDFQRIIVAAFSKDTPLKFSKKVASKGGKWDFVNLEAWVEKGKFASENQTMMLRAKELFSQNCGICHALHKENEFNVNQWAATFRGMVSRTGIDKKDHWLVIEYLQKNAKDFKGGIK